MNMNSSSSNSQSMETSSPKGGPSKKVRKPYTITKSRKRWTDEEHDKFLEALQLFNRDWKKIEDYVGSKTVIQIRSHAQKYFLKVQKNSAAAHVPPPRPKRKASHPYPQKATNNGLVPLQAPLATYPSTLSCLLPGHSPWNGTSLVMNTALNGNVPSDEYTNLHTLGLVTATLVALEAQVKQCPKQGIPDFAEVYSFIGSIFDPDTKGHLQKLKEMDPINIETVVLLMGNLTINLTSPGFEPIDVKIEWFAYWHWRLAV